MDELNEKQLERIRQLLNQADKPALERLANAACMFLTALIDHEVTTRSEARAKNKPR